VSEIVLVTDAQLGFTSDVSQQKYFWIPHVRLVARWWSPAVCRI